MRVDPVHDAWRLNYHVHRGSRKREGEESVALVGRRVIWDRGFDISSKK